MFQIVFWHEPQRDSISISVLSILQTERIINWRQLHAQSGIDKSSKSTYAFKDPNSNDAHIVLWEMKL